MARQVDYSNQDRTGGLIDRVDGAQQRTAAADPADQTTQTSDLRTWRQRPTRPAAAMAATTLAAATALIEPATPHEPRARQQGQVATPSLLADLMAGWALRDGARTLLDPACGAGSLLARATAWTGATGAPAARVIGVETDNALAQEARRRLAALGAEAQIVDDDFLALATDALATAGWAPVDAVVANPPFVRHERVLTVPPPRLASAVGNLSGRSDLHAYFWPALATCMAPGARIAALAPASWLEADYGAALRAYLHRAFIVDALIEPAIERWFGVGVHTVLLLGRRRPPPAATEPNCRLIRLRRPLADLLPATGDGRVAAVAGLIARIDALTADADTDEWRVRLIPSSRLSQRAPAVGVRPATTRPAAARNGAHRDPTEAAGWLPCAAWLRAPTSLVQLLAATAERWTRLGDLAQVRYPLKSGADRFFYLTAETAEVAGIDPRYLRPLVRSPRDLPGLTVTPERLRWRVLSLPAVPLEQLPPAVRRYLARGVADGLDRRPTCAGRRPWYALPPLSPAPLLWPRFVHARHAVWLNPAGVQVNQTVYGLLVAPSLTLPLAAVANSRIGALLMEACGRGSLGDGALQYAVSQAAGVPLPDPRRATPAQCVALSEALLTLAAAPAWAPLAGPSAARDALDDLTLALLGIADRAQRVDLAAAIAADLDRLVAERHRRGRRAGCER